MILAYFVLACCTTTDPCPRVRLFDLLLVQPQDRMPDPVTRLGFADTLAWGVKTLRTSSPLSSLFDPALSPPTNDQQPFTNYARLSGNPDMRRTTWPSSTALSACSSSSSSFPQLSTISSSPSPACDGNDSTTTTMSTSTTSSNPTIYLVKVLQKLKNDYYAAGGDGRTALVKAGDDAAKDSGDVLPSGRFRACASLVAQRGNATLLAPMCEHSMQ